MSEFNKILNQKAVALSYDAQTDKAPVIVASGKGHLAERIVELACENDVPVYEDNSLTNILSQMELGSEIPTELYQMVVDIYVYFLNMVPEQVEKGGEAGKKRKNKEIGKGGKNREGQEAVGDRGARGNREREESGRDLGAGKNREREEAWEHREDEESGKGEESGKNWKGGESWGSWESWGSGKSEETKESGERGNWSNEK